MIRRLTFATVIVVSHAGSVLAQDAAAGERSFSQCKICHLVGDRASHGVGPELNGIVGRKAGSAPGFAYSAAMGGSGIVWTEAKLREFLRDPKGVVPDNAMPFGGITDEQQLNDIVAYLLKFRTADK